MNEHRTAPNSDTDLTQAVPEAFTGLVQMRSRHGYDSPVGHRCSNILEMLDAGTAKPADIARQVSELSSLISKGNCGGET